MAAKKHGVSHADFASILKCKRFLAAIVICSLLSTFIFLVSFTYISSWLRVGIARNQLADAISIANTYIVFTTLFFVIFSAAITFAGIWFSRQFSMQKEEQLNKIVNDVIEMFSRSVEDGGKGVSEKLIEKALDNADSEKYFQQRIESAVTKAIAETIKAMRVKAEKVDEEAQAAIDQAQEDLSNLDKLAQ